MSHYNELHPHDACSHDVMIAMDRLQSDQEEMFGESPGLFAEEIASVAGWSVLECQRALRNGLDRGLLEIIPIANSGNTGKCSYRIVRQ